jgi:predicted nucleic acid-binding protein
VPFVLDASVAGPWILADESSPAAARIADLLVTDRAFVPPIWWYEVRNLLVVSERRGRLAWDDSAAFLTLVADFDIAIDPAVERDETVLLARRHRLTVYDAAYLELALRRQLPLATLDTALAAAARSAGVPLLA